MSKNLIYPDWGCVEELDEEIKNLYKQQELLNSKITKAKKELGKSVFLHHQYFDLNEVCEQYPKDVDIDKLVVLLKNKRLENVYADCILEIKHDREHPYIDISDSDYVGSIDLITGEFVTYSYGFKSKNPNVIGIREIVTHEREN